MLNNRNIIKKFGVIETKSKDEYIRQLISQGENQHLDFKFEISDSRKIARSLVAFANTDGGILLVGVKDNGVIAGVRSEEEYYMVEAAASLYCAPEIKFNTHEYNIQGKSVLKISINKSLIVKHKAPDKNNEMKYYVRVDDQNLLAHPVQLIVWKLQQQKEHTQFCIKENERSILEYLIIHPKVHYTLLINDLKISKFKTNQILAHLIYYKLLKFKLLEKDILFHLNENITDIEEIQFS